MSKYNYGLAIKKFMINQFGAALFGFLIFNAATMISLKVQESNPNLNYNVDLLIDIIVCILCTLFYMLLLYTAYWDIGAKDKISIDAGKLDYDMLRGLKGALLGNIPNFIIAFLLIAGTLLFYISKVNFFGSMADIGNIMATVWESMFNGIYSFFRPTSDITLTSVILTLNYLVIIIPSLFICTLGYIAGINNKGRLGKKK